MVYEATQLSLRRTVALRLIDAAHFAAADELARFDDRQRLVASLHHPNLVPCYEAGVWEGGRFVATRFIRGRSLADLRSHGSPVTAAALVPIANALAAAHAVGIAHGDISERNILIEADGSAYLADLGLADGAGAEADLSALASIIERLPEEKAIARTRTARRPGRLALATAATVAVIAGAMLATGADDEPHALEAPLSPEATRPLGSALAPGPLEPIGCRAEPTPNTPACTLAPRTIAGSEIYVQEHGVIRSWAVRGASGELALQVVRKLGGNSYVAGFSQPQRIDVDDPIAFPAQIPVRPGDVIGVRLAPGSTIGARRAARSSIARWDGGLTGEPARKADHRTMGLELMLRADIEVGGSPEGPRQLLGERAAAAPDGRRLSEQSTELSGGRPARVVLVELPRTIAIDVISGERIARIAVPDAELGGALSEFAQSCGSGGVRGLCLRWRNPGTDQPLEHEYRVRGDGRIDLIG